MQTSTIETGLSDHHKLTATVLKSEFVKGEPTVVTYRDYKNLNAENFASEVQNVMSGCPPSNYHTFSTNLRNTLDKHAPLKHKLVRANNAPFMNTAIRKQIMLRSTAKNKFNKCKTPDNWNKYKRIRNSCVKLIRKTKRNYFKNIDINFVSDNKRFWQTIRPAFTNKIKAQNKIILVEDENIISSSKVIAETMNDYFINITKSLHIADFQSKQLDMNSDKSDRSVTNDTNSLDTIISSFKHHPSILKIKQHTRNVTKFNFKKVSVNEIRAQIKSLDAKKATGPDQIPPKILKLAISEIEQPLTDIFNKSLESKSFPSNLKEADVTPIYKKDSPTSKKNFRPISILPATSKIFERIIFNQLYASFYLMLSPFLCGFRKGYGTQHALIRYIEDLKNCLDSRKIGGTVLMDLSKAFDCLSHELLLAKLEAYGLSKDALLLIQDYLQGRFQRVKINSKFSEWKRITKGVPQGSVLGPLLFNIFINDICLSLDQSKLCNYADDNTIWIEGTDKEGITIKLEQEMNLINQWFEDNAMQLNGDKCKLMMISTKPNNVEKCSVNVNRQIIKEEDKVKLLGVTIDNQLKFDDHIKNMCKEAGKKINALARIAPYLNEDKRKLLMKTFVLTFFNYCPLVWMYCSRKNNKLINNIHERALRIAYNDFSSNFEQLLLKDNTVTNHTRNLKQLATEIYKTIHHENPRFMEEIFSINESPYNLRGVTFTRNKPNTVAYGLDTISYRCQEVWNSIPTEITSSPNINIFKASIKNLSTISCSCRICKPFIGQIGYIE